MPSADASLKGLSALAAFAFGSLVLAANPKKPANRWLALFLFLIAGNQAAEAMRALYEDPASRLLWRRVASVFASLDPVALYYFASLYPERNRLNAWPRVVPVLVPAALFAFYGGWLLPAGEPPGVPEAQRYAVALVVYTAAVYLVVLARLLDAMLGEPASPWGRMLFAAGCVAAFELPVQALTELPYLTPFRPPPGTQPLFDLAMTALAAPLVPLWVVLHARRRAPSPSAMRGVRAGLVAGFVMLAGWVGVTVLGGQLSRAGHPLGDAFGIAGRTLVSVRWLLFGLLVSTAILRHDPFGMSLKARRRAARGLVGLLFLALGVQVAQVVAGGADIPLWALVAIGSAVALSQGFRSFVDLVAWRVYGVPMREDPEARVEAFRIAASRALAEGRPPDDPSLERLRRELGLDTLVARVILDAAETGGGPLAAGQVVARRYRVLRMLGHGGQARVFLARDERLARDVVLKEIALPAPEAAEDALQEARLAGGVGHPNVVTMHDVLVRPDSVVLVAEHVPGGSLEDVLRERGQPAPEEAARILRGVLRGLAELHRRGVVHRDLKPANVLLAADGAPKLADFGLARLRGAETTRTRAAWALAGTLPYMAPEQRQGERARPQTDVYAVGLLARALLREPPPAVEAVLARALSDDVESRWRDAGEMLAALDAGLAAQAW